MIRTGALILALLLTGCMQRIGDLTVVATGNVDLTRINDSIRARAVVAEGTNYTWIFPSSLEEAFDRAMDTGHGNVMEDARIYYYYGFFVSGYRVRGRVLQVP